MDETVPLCEHCEFHRRRGHYEKDEFGGQYVKNVEDICVRLYPVVRREINPIDGCTVNHREGTIYLCSNERGFTKTLREKLSGDRSGKCGREGKYFVEDWFRQGKMMHEKIKQRADSMEG